LVGCKDVKELSKKQIIVTGKLKDFFEARGYLR
jgi:isopentenyl diphosphate isomerase/L-lactate dehydrogenase-like FMN-dependent dehydrogenase